VNVAWSKALVLDEQGRYEMAAKELQGAAAGDPEDPWLHGLLALCLSLNAK